MTGVGKWAHKLSSKHVTVQVPALAPDLQCILDMQLLRLQAPMRILGKQLLPLEAPTPTLISGSGS